MSGKVTTSRIIMLVGKSAYQIENVTKRDQDHHSMMIEWVQKGDLTLAAPHLMMLGYGRTPIWEIFPGRTLFGISVRADFVYFVFFSTCGPMDGCVNSDSIVIC